MELFLIIIALFYLTTGIIRNIIYILDRLDTRTEKHNEELRKKLKLG